MVYYGMYVFEKLGVRVFVVFVLYCAENVNKYFIDVVYS